MKDAAFALPLALLAAPIPADEALKSGRDLLREAEAQITHIDTPTLQQRLKEEPSLVRVDVRTPNEVGRMGGTIDAPGSKAIPFS